MDKVSYEFVCTTLLNYGKRGNRVFHSLDQALTVEGWSHNKKLGDRNRSLSLEVGGLKMNVSFVTRKDTVRRIASSFNFEERKG